MPNQNINLANKSGGLVESFRNDQPRVTFLALIIAGLLLILVGGLAYQQVIKQEAHTLRGETQSRRLTITPGPRGEIYDRYGRVLVANQHRLSVVLEVDKLQTEIYRQKLKIRAAYKEYDESAATDIPTDGQMQQIARVTVAQKYLDQVNGILGRSDRIDGKDLLRHFSQELLLPYVLLDNLDGDQFAKLLEQLPVDSPIQVNKYSVREYPYGAAAAHLIGEVKWESDIEADLPPGTDDLITFKTKGIVGRDGIEQRFESQLKGKAGTTVYRVNPGGYKRETPLSQVWPQSGENLTTSLDIDLQLAGEKEFAAQADGLSGAFVALDVNTGEVLALASFPNYDLRETSPRVSTETWEKILAANALPNRALTGTYPPGSTFKLITSLAGMRSGDITPESTYVTNGTYLVGNHAFHDAHGDQTGLIDYQTALSKSINTYFINFGMKIGAPALAAEAARMHLGEKTGFELPETSKTYVGTDAWKRRQIGEGWQPGDTANLAFGQGFIAITPMQMACFIASFARGETQTKPTMIHDPNHPRQKSEPIGIAPADYNAIVEAMKKVPITGTASGMQKFFPTPGLIVAGKTGTAQKDITDDKGNQAVMEIGWYICFAPVENPQIAIACVVEGEAHEVTQGGRFAAPVAHAILQAWWKKAQKLTTQKQ